MTLLFATSMETQMNYIQVLCVQKGAQQKNMGRFNNPIVSKVCTHNSDFVVAQTSVYMWARECQSVNISMMSIFKVCIPFKSWREASHKSAASGIVEKCLQLTLLQLRRECNKKTETFPSLVESRLLKAIRQESGGWLQIEVL